MNAQHSSGSQEWLTPIWLLEGVKEVLGTIDLDPASSAFANRRVKATHFLTHKEDGLRTPWGSRGAPLSFFCNPPGGTVILPRLDGGIGRPASSQAMFWRQAMSQVDLGHVSHGIFLSFSLEALSRTQTLTCRAMTDYPICIPPKRIRYDDQHGNPGASPTHASALIYVPGKIDRSGLFARVFQKAGALLSPGIPFNWKSPSKRELEARDDVVP